MEVDGEVGVTITLGGPDEDLWRIEDGPGLYMYKLIVARRYAGRGLGALITNWVCDKAARCGYPLAPDSTHGPRRALPGGDARFQAPPVHVRQQSRRASLLVTGE